MSPVHSQPLHTGPLLFRGLKASVNSPGIMAHFPILLLFYNMWKTGGVNPRLFRSSSPPSTFPPFSLCETNKNKAQGQESRGQSSDDVDVDKRGFSPQQRAQILIRDFWSVCFQPLSEILHMTP